MLSSRPVNLNTDAPYFSTKTPGRALKSNRAENAHAGISMTVNRNLKGKEIGVPRTPFQPSSVQPQRLFKGEKLDMNTTRPLGDKTPLPNRIAGLLLQTPAAQKQNSKLSQFSFIDQDVTNPTTNKGSDNTPGSLQRPSSMRKHPKHPNSGGRKSNSFQTPMNQGNHWDVSDGDIMLDSQPLLTETIMELADDSDDSDVEYGPPNTLNLPYQPPFDFEMPDYRVLGKSMRDLAFSFPCGETFVPSEPEISPSEIKVDWELLPLPDFVDIDDPFYQARAELKASVQPSTTIRKPFTGTISGSKMRPQSSMARIQSKPLPRVTRPAAATSVYAVSNTARGIPTGSSRSILSRQTVVEKPVVAKPALKTNSKAGSTTTTTGSSVVHKPLTLATKPRTAVSTAAPIIKSARAPITSATATTTARRPQTSLAVTSSNSARKLKQPGPAARADPDVLVFVNAEDGCEDFQFDI